MTRILLDECLPVKLKFRLQENNPDFKISTVTGKGWAGIKNGKLLEMAQKEFDAFVTIDQNLSYQQNISDLNISIIVLQVKSNRYKELLAYVDLITDVASSTEKGKLYEIFLSTS